MHRDTSAEDTTTTDAAEVLEAPARRRPARRRVTRPAGAAAPAETFGITLPTRDGAPAGQPDREVPTGGQGPAGDHVPSEPVLRLDDIVLPAGDAGAAGNASAERGADSQSAAPSTPTVRHRRLAATALVFQQPDFSKVPPRPRRARRDEDAPRPVGDDAGSQLQDRNVQDGAVRDGQDEGTETLKPSARRSASRRGAAGNRAANSAANAAGNNAEVEELPAEAVTMPMLELHHLERDLTRDEKGAAKAIEDIEAELIADGVEIEEFSETDWVDDTETEIDRGPRRRRRGGRGRRGSRRDGLASDVDEDSEDDEAPTGSSSAAAEPDSASETGQSRKRRRGTRTERAERARGDVPTALKGSTRLEAKRQRRRESRDNRRRHIITEAEFLARRESVKRSMVVREREGRTQIAVLEDGVLVEHYVSAQSQLSMVGNVYLGRVQNVLPSMEAAFMDVGKGRNAVLYAGEVNWDAAGLDSGQPRRIETALKPGDSVLVQVTKDSIGHKGARLTAQITLAGRYLVLVPGGGMTGISRKLPESERTRLKKILREVVPDSAGVIVRTAAEGASETELKADVDRLMAQWNAIESKVASKPNAPVLLQGEPDLAIRVVRDIFNDDFAELIVDGEGAWTEVSEYVDELAPDLRERVRKWAENTDVFSVYRVDEQLAKGMDRKVWLPSGGSLVIDRTEAMTVIDVNTGKFTGAGGTLEETVTKNNVEAAEEIVRQLRLRDIGGIIVIDFIDMVLESNRDLVLRRLVECLGRDRTKHQVAEVTSLGLVQMTRKRVGQGLVEAFSETCEACKGRGFIVHSEPTLGQPPRRNGNAPDTPVVTLPEENTEAREAVKATLATIAAAAASAHAEAEADVEQEGGNAPSSSDIENNGNDGHDRAGSDTAQGTEHTN
ncbi:MAG: Rne/Rng family ribonuclease [Cellulomonadaceae bacterium]|nr:Rne/Rng family ribonuclease [Cellulomonadaceae bacterium]